MPAKKMTLQPAPHASMANGHNWLADNVYASGMRKSLTLWVFASIAMLKDAHLVLPIKVTFVTHVKIQLFKSQMEDVDVLRDHSVSIAMQ